MQDFAWENITIMNAAWDQQVQGGYARFSLRKYHYSEWCLVEVFLNLKIGDSSPKLHTESSLFWKGKYERGDVSASLWPWVWTRMMKRRLTDRFSLAQSIEAQRESESRDGLQARRHGLIPRSSSSWLKKHQPYLHMPLDSELKNCKIIKTFFFIHCFNCPCPKLTKKRFWLFCNFQVRYWAPGRHVRVLLVFLQAGGCTPVEEALTPVAHLWVKGESQQRSNSVSFLWRGD